MGNDANGLKASDIADMLKVESVTVPTNTYTYAANNPVSSIDPTGQIREDTVSEWDTSSDNTPVADVSYGDSGGAAFGFSIAADELFVKPVKTLLDQNSSPSDKVIAGASLGLNFVGGGEGEAASKALPVVAKSQIGKKLVDHAMDYGLTISREGAQEYAEITQNVLQNVEQIRVGPWKTLGPNTEFWISGDNVAIVQENGNWVSTFPLTNPGTIEHIMRQVIKWSK